MSSELRPTYEKLGQMNVFTVLRFDPYSMQYVHYVPFSSISLLKSDLSLDIIISFYFGVLVCKSFFPSIYPRICGFAISTSRPLPSITGSWGDDPSSNALFSIAGGVAFHRTSLLPSKIELYSPKYDSSLH
jgi:hypothetical protein